MAKKMSAQDKKAVEERLKLATDEIKNAKDAVSALPSVPGSTPPEYTAAQDSEPGGKPCGRLYDAKDSIEAALSDLGGRPCGGGRPC